MEKLGEVRNGAVVATLLQAKREQWNALSCFTTYSMICSPCSFVCLRQFCGHACGAFAASKLKYTNIIFTCAFQV